MISESTPLIVVDVQNGFLNKSSSHVLGPIRRLVEKWTDEGRPVFFTRFINTTGSQWEEWIDWHRLKESPEIDLSEELADLSVTASVVDKHSYSGVVGALEEALVRDGWDSAVVCGIATDGCVMQTAIDLFERRVQPLVVVEACSSHAGDEVHQMGLRLIARAIGKKQLVEIETLL